VASHLLKYCHFKEDTEGDRYELRFLRDQLGHEVDFVVLKNKIPQFAVECKTGEKQISKSLNYFKSRTKIPKFFQVHRGTKSYQSEGISVIPFTEFCLLLN
jgi:predicted AAA+ superfamily ATPase